MTDRVISCNRWGMPLDELDATVARQWVLERTIAAGKGQLTMPANSPKATDRLLRENNIIYVESDQDGIPPWAGIIWPRFYCDGHVIQIGLRSCEWLLAQRFTDSKQKPLNGNPSNVAAVFESLFHLAGREYPLPVKLKTPVFAIDDAPYSVTWNAANIFETCNELANDTRNFWWFEPSRNSTTGRIEFTPNIQKRAGRVYLKRIEMDDNFVGVKVTKEGEIANQIRGYARFEDWTNPVTYAEENKTSAAKYGYVQAVENFMDVDTEAGLVAPVRAALKRRAFPYLSVTGNIFEPPYPLAGMKIFPKVSPGFEFMTGGRVVIPMVVTSAAYDPITNSMSISATEFVDDL